MTSGHTGDLYVLAFDHRGSFAREVLGIEEGLTDEQVELVRDAKRMIFDGVLDAVGSGLVPRGQAGVLVDEQFGADVARHAPEHGIAVSLAVERSSREVFEFEYGDSFGDHIERFEPSFAKVLVRFNAEGDERRNATQLERLRTLSQFLVDGKCKLMYELLVPPLEAQLGRLEGDSVRYQRELRPELIVRGIAAAQEAGIEPDVWKVEGVETRADAGAIAARVRNIERRRAVSCIVLGAGASDERVGHWIDVAARTEGYVGFAIGRSIWRVPVRDYLDGRSDRGRAAHEVALRFAALVERWRSTRGENEPARDRPPPGCDQEVEGR